MKATKKEIREAVSYAFGQLVSEGKMKYNSETDDYEFVQNKKNDKKSPKHKKMTPVKKDKYKRFDSEKDY